MPGFSVANMEEQAPADSIAEVVESYKAYIGKRNPQLSQRLNHRERENPEGVMLEAAIFSVGWSYGLTPEIAEIAGEGGPDFLCGKGDYKFLLEVTHVSTKTIESHSGMPAKPSPGHCGTSGW